MRVVTTITVCCLVLGAGAGGIWLLNHYKKEPEKVKPQIERQVVISQLVQRGDKRIDVTTQGTVKPRTEIDLVAQVAGEVRSISPSLASGGFFAAGDVLVQLDKRDYELEETRIEALVAQAELRVSLEEAEAEIARREWKSLGKGEATPLTLREPQVQEAKAALAAAKAALGKASLALARTTIKAPFAGRVRRKGVDVGQFVTMGSTLARIYAVDFAEVRLPLHDSQLRYLDLPLSVRGGVRNGKAPEVTLRTRFAQEVHEWRATIVRTEGEVDAKSRMVHAIARVQDPYGKDGSRQRLPLAVGMFVEATIHGRTFKQVIEIPRQAVRGDNEVLRIDGDNRLHRHEIEILHRGTDTVIVSEGLDDGDRICLSPIAVFFEGMQVDLRESASRAEAANGNGGDPR